MFNPKTLIGLLCLCPAIIFGSTPSNATELNTAIINANANVDTSITFANSFDFTGFTGVNLTPVNILTTFQPANRTITINGSNNTLTGTGPSDFRGFFIRGGTGSVIVQNLTFNQCTGIGGDNGSPGTYGGNGGGGGGLGGGLYIGDGATVTLHNLSFTNCIAQGGSGATSGGSFISYGGAGGGGFRGKGGNCPAPSATFAGGTGGGGIEGNGGDQSAADGGIYLGGTGGGDAANGVSITSGFSTVDGTNGGGDFSGAGGGLGGVGSGSNGANGTTGAGGGGAGNNAGGAAGTAGTSNTTANSGGGGGGGGGGVVANGTARDGALGGPFGGGGGGGSANLTNVGETATLAAGGDGGFAGGGGGGGGSNNSSGGVIGRNGGNGGFAGGGGAGGGVEFGSGSQQGSGGQGGYGGGTGGNGSSTFLNPSARGGGGAGFGGAIFVEDGAVATFTGTLSFSNSDRFGGSGANAGLADGYDIFVMSGAELIFQLDNGFNLTLTESIVGNQGRLTSSSSSPTTGGGLRKRGSNLMTLVGTNTYTGTTWVEAGELRIFSSLITDVVVSNGATLSGNVNILKDINGNGGNLTNAGVVSPGINGVGSITIDGSYSQSSDGRLVIDITPDGQADRLFMNTNGTATLAGTLEVVLGSGNYVAGTTYTIINGPTLGSTFENVVKTGANANTVDIRVDYSSVIITILSSLLFEDQSINPGAPSEVANAFRKATIIPGSDFATIAAILGTLSTKAVNRALTSLSPVAFGALEWINERNNSYVADLLSQHLFELCCSPRECCGCDCNTSVWINVFGNLMDNTKWLDTLQPFEANAIGALGGIDFCCGPFYYGASVGYTHTHLIWKNLGGKGNLDSYYGALYGSLKCDCFSVDISAIGGGTDQHLSRRIVFDNIDRVAKSDPWGYFATAHLGLRSQ